MLMFLSFCFLHILYSGIHKNQRLQLVQGSQAQLQAQTVPHQTESRPRCKFQRFFIFYLHPLFVRPCSFLPVRPSSKTPTTTRWSSPWPAGTAARSSGRSAWSTTPSSGSSRSPSPNPSPSCSPEGPPSGSGEERI